MIVLDTHTVVWALAKHPRLSLAAKRSIESAERQGVQLTVASSSLYEVANGVVRGRIEANLALADLLREIEIRFLIQPLTAEIALAAAQLPATFPSDPFDRIITATALVSGAVLITADERIRHSGAVRTVW